MSLQGGMTAVYGILTNNSQQDIVLVGGKTATAGGVQGSELLAEALFS
jgi:copper(I)-binding protein